MRVASLVVVVAPHTGKIIKNPPCFWKRRKLLQNGIFHSR